MELPIITVNMAANIMHKDPAFIRKGLQNGSLPFGSAIMVHGMKYSYYISPPKFYDYIGKDMKGKKTIKFKDGEITVPDYFIELDLIAPENAEIPMVMTVKNENLFGTPDFVFFGNTYPCNLTEDETNSLYAQAEKYYPGYSKLNDQIINVEWHKDNNGNTTHEFVDLSGSKRTKEEWAKAPCIGIFQAEMRTSVDDDSLPYGIEIHYNPGRDPRINHELLNR